MNNSRKFIFIVQGEGRGHMTQAIGLYNILTNAGHQVQQIFIGKSDRRAIPEYFLKSFSCPVQKIDSPNFVVDKANKKIRLISSILHNLKYLRRYYGSLNIIHNAVKKNKPDYLVTFYEFLGGYYHYIFPLTLRNT